MLMLPTSEIFLTAMMYGRPVVSVVWPRCPQHKSEYLLGEFCSACDLEALSA